MYETADELDELQRLFDRSIASAGPHLLSIAHEGRLLTARQVATHLVGTRHLAVATVTSDGRPIVSMADGHFLHARFWFGTDASSVKVRHLRARGALSAVHAVGDELALTMHGHGVLVGRADEGFDQLEEHFRSVYGSAPSEWSPDPVFVRIEPSFAFAYASDAGAFPG